MNKTKKEVSFGRRVLRQLGKMFLSVAAVCVVIVAYGEVKTRWAKHQVEAFADLVIIGQPITGLENKAKEMHLNYRGMGPVGGKDGAFVVWEGFVFDRWFCDVEYKNGKATAKKISFLD